jgi:hypothetical protein
MTQKSGNPEISDVLQTGDFFGHDNKESWDWKKNIEAVEAVGANETEGEVFYVLGGGFIYLFYFLNFVVSALKSCIK